MTGCLIFSSVNITYQLSLVLQLILIPSNGQEFQIPGPGPVCPILNNGLGLRFVPKKKKKVEPSGDELLCGASSVCLLRQDKKEGCI